MFVLGSKLQNVRAFTHFWRLSFSTVSLAKGTPLMAMPPTINSCMFMGSQIRAGHLVGNLR